MAAVLTVSVLLDGVEDEALQVLVVAQGAVAADLARAAALVKVVVQRRAGAVLAPVVGIGRDAQETHQREQLAHALQKL